LITYGCREWDHKTRRWYYHTNTGAEATHNGYTGTQSPIPSVIQIEVLKKISNASTRVCGLAENFLPLFYMLMFLDKTYFIKPEGVRL
jgi:hypothetical protein